METLIALWPYISGGLIPLVLWISRKVIYLEKKFDKIDDLEKRISKHENDNESIKDRVSHLELTMVRIETKLDMILKRLESKNDFL